MNIQSGYHPDNPCRTGEPSGRIAVACPAGHRVRLLFCLAIVILASGAVPPLLFSQQPANVPAVTPSRPQSGSIRDLENLLTSLVVREAGLEWSDDKHWGEQERIWAGFRFRRDDGRLETERVWKEVNHGSWEKYSAKVRPGAENFRITFPNIEAAPDGSSRITVNVRAVLDIEARQSQWSRGVQLYSISGTGWADVEVSIRVTVTTRPDYTELPPALVISPTVTDAEIVLHRFQLDRVSKLGGEFSQQVSRAARKIIEDKLEEKKTDIVAKLNRQIEKNRKHLRFSMHDLELPEFVRFWDRATGKDEPPPTGGDKE